MKNTEQLKALFLKILFWHHIFGLIPLGLSFLTIAFTRNFNSAIYLILVFFMFWIIEAIYLKYLNCLPLLKMRWKIMFFHGIDDLNDIDELKIGKLPFLQIISSTFLTTNYLGWILMLTIFSLIFSFL